MKNTLNRSLTDIEECHNEEMQREMIRNKFSALLTDTNKFNRINFEHVIGEDEAVGLSSLDLCWIMNAWQHPTEGWIRFGLDTGGTMDFDDFDNDELIKILENLIIQTMS